MCESREEREEKERTAGMKIRWPEEMDWIRQQDQMMYRLINILSVAAMLFLVCVISYRAASFGTVSASTDASAENIILKVSGYQMCMADTFMQDAQQGMAESEVAVLNMSVQDVQLASVESDMALQDATGQDVQTASVESDMAIQNENGQNVQSASAESDMVVLDVAARDEQQIAEQADEYADLSYAEINNCVDDRRVFNRDYDALDISYDGCKGVATEIQKTVGGARDDPAHYAAVRADCRGVRGQPDIKADCVI